MIDTLEYLRKIDGLEPRVPVGAVLRIGEKDKNTGVPTNTDHFQIVSPHESPLNVKRRSGKEVDVGQRLPLEEFRFFNSKRLAVFRGFLVHADMPGSFGFDLVAQVLPGKRADSDGGGKWPVHPSRMPSCSSSDGKTAKRLYETGETTADDRWEFITCPNRECEFREAKACKVTGTLVFMPRWKIGSGADQVDWVEGAEIGEDRPRPLMKWVNHSWNTTTAVMGFFEWVAKAAADFGVERYSFWGIPFILRLHKKKDRRRGNVFPVVSMTPDGDLFRFLHQQRQALESLGGRPKLLAAASTAQDETEPETRAVDLSDITDLRRPRTQPDGDVIDAEAEEITETETATEEQPGTADTSETEPETTEETTAPPPMLSEAAQDRIRKALADCDASPLDLLAWMKKEYGTANYDEIAATEELAILSQVQALRGTGEKDR